MTEPNQFPPQRPPPVIPYQTPVIINPSGLVVCPKCGWPQAKRATFTWWGGLVGPKLLNHVNCVQCGAGYNGKTGRSNDKAITIYLVVAVVIGLAVGVALVLMARA